MATCKDCIHLRVCKACEIEKPEEICNHFKNKADVQEVKHGKWIENKKVCASPYCSVCGAIGGASYCSHCGAKMDLEEE